MTGPTGEGPARRPEIPEHLRAALGGPADSAGVPWGGRELHTSSFAGDTGEADPVLLGALRAVTVDPLDPRLHRSVVSALAEKRLFAPILPAVLEQSVDERGLMHDNSSEMAMVRLRSGDGREATPAFSDIPSLTAWHPEARPVPIEAERLGAAAVEEGAQLVVIDPGTPHTFLLRRPALWAFLQRKPWMPAWADATVASALHAAASGFPWIGGVGMGPATAAVQAAGPEIRVEVRTAQTAADAQRSDFQRALAENAVIAEQVDSLTLSFVEQ